MGVENQAFKNLAYHFFLPILEKVPFGRRKSSNDHICLLKSGFGYGKKGGGIRVREPNEFEDTYSVNKYNSVVAEYLYTCDFEWYFALVDENDIYYQYAGISKADHMYTSADQWTDENFLSLIDACINLND